MLSVNCKAMIYRALFVCMCSVFLNACSEDLNPSDSDLRPAVQLGTTGNSVGQNASDFTVLDTLGNSINLSDELAENDAVVIYFTMWCPLCDSHMSSMRRSVVPEYPNVRFIIVDFVTGSVSQSRSVQESNGYSSTTVVADVDYLLTRQFDGDMGITIVIGPGGEILMNEDYKQSKLTSTLTSILP